MKKDEENTGENTLSESVNSQSLTFDESVKHLSGGYANSQSTVRFLDTKASAVVGFVPIVISLLVTVFRWVGGWPEWRAIDGGLLLAVAILLTLATLTSLSLTVLYGGKSIGFALRCLLPRDLGESKPSVLFPFRRSGESESQDEMYDRISLFAEDASQQHLLDDHRHQLDRMASIVGEKLSYVQRSIEQVKPFLMWSGVTAGVIFAQSLANSFVLDVDDDRQNVVLPDAALSSEVSGEADTASQPGSKQEAIISEPLEFLTTDSPEQDAIAPSLNLNPDAEQSHP